MLKKLTHKLKSCFGFKSSKVEPETILLSSQLQYIWYGHPTTTCCKQIISACYSDHLNCLIKLLEYEEKVLSENKKYKIIIIKYFNIYYIKINE